MSRKRRRGLSPSLFPFLAVLVCTLGTLILMLAIVATGGTQPESIADASAADAAVAIDEAKRIAAEADFRMTELVEFRAAQTADAERRRNELTHLEQHTDRLADQLAKLSDEVERAIAGTKTAPDDQLDDQLNEIEDEIARKQAELESAVEQQKLLRQRVVIVPHRGPSGTMRRPIYLECRGDGLTIWPEGIQLSIEQLEIAADHPDQPDANPLDVALRTARMHAMRVYGDPEPPYPMLVVRPDGIDAYAAARAAMGDWDDQYGYELVAGEVELAFPAADIELKSSLAKVVKRATAAQSTLSSRSFAGAGNPATRDDIPMPSRGKTPRVISAADMAARRGDGLFQADNQFRVARDATNVPANDPLASVVNLSRGNGSGGSSNQLGGDSSTGNFQRTTPSGGNDFTGGQTGGQTEDEWMRALAGQSDSSSAGDGGQSDGPLDAGQEFGGGGDANAKQHDSFASSAGGGDSSKSDASVTGQQNGGMSEAFDGQASDSKMAGTHAMGSMTSPEDAPPPRPDDFKADQTAQSSKPDPRKSSTESGSPSQNESINRSGPDWALPDNVRRGGTNAIVRSIPVQITAESIQVGGQNIPIDPRNPAETNRRAAIAARQTMQHWGAAMAGGRWQPRMIAEVAAGGDRRCDDLERYLNGSGIDFVRRTQTASRPPATGLPAAGLPASGLPAAVSPATALPFR